MIDQNHSLYWPLFKHMSDTYGLTLLDSEMEDICRVVLNTIKPKQTNQHHSCHDHKKTQERRMGIANQ